MQKPQQTYDLFDLYLRCANKSQKASYALFIFDIYSYNKNDRYIKLPKYIFKIDQIVDKYFEIYQNQNRIPQSINDFVGLQTFGIKYRINRIKTRIQLNGIRGIDQLINPYLDEILGHSLELYRLSCDFIRSLDFNLLVNKVLERFIPNPVNDDEELPEIFNLKYVDNTVDCKSLEEITVMLDNYTINEIKQQINPVEKATKILSKDEKDAIKLEKLRIKQQKILDKIKLLENKK